MWILFQAEFYKIMKSFGFKIAFLGILFLSLFHIVYEYSYFSQYDFFYEGYKKEYVKKVEESKEFLEDPTSHSYFKDHIEELKREIQNIKHYLEFYITHKIPSLKKDFSQGLSKSIFNYEEFLLLILVFCCNSVCYEKSKNITAFQFSSKVSRGELYFSKILALALAVTIIFVVNILFSYIFSGILMGFSDLSGQIQALREYSFAPIERSIKEFLILKIIFGWLICMSATVVFHFISTITKDSLTSYIVSAIVILQSSSLYFGIEYLKHIIIGTYYAYQQYIYGLIVYDIKITILNMIFQTICIYFLGLYIYKRME